MKLLVLQLSDIHFREGDNVLMSRVDAIKAAVLSADAGFSCCLLAVTGDVTFSGKPAEYNIATEFFDRLNRALASMRSDIQIDEIFIPGNHDCDLPHQPRARQVLINSILSDPPQEGDLDDSLLEACLHVQDNFFGFVASRGGDASGFATANRRLKYDKTILCQGKRVLVQCYNTAWMSQLQEGQGQLLAPTWLPGEPPEGMDLVVTIFHHPYNWLEAVNGKRFRKMVDHSSDIVMSGHEHVAEQYSKSGISGDASEYFEGAVLQDGDERDSGFNLIVVDLDGQRSKSQLYRWDGGRYAVDRQADWRAFHRARILDRRRFENTDTYLDFLHDPGAAFSHPEKPDLKLGDIFVYPDLYDKSFSKKKSAPALPRMVSSQNVVEYIKKHKQVLLIGGEKAGKTTLSKALYLDFHSAGYVPLRVQGEGLKSPDEETTLRVLDRAVAEQYGRDMVEAYRQLAPKSKLLIVDDFQRIKLNRKGTNAIVETLTRQAEAVVVLVGDVYSLEEIADQEVEQNVLRTFRHCVLRECGHLLRAKMIEKWYTLGREYTTDEIDISRKVQETERLLNTLLGKNLLPAYPVFILSILQGSESTTNHNKELGSYGYYYEALITGALSLSTSKITLDTLYTYVSRIAYSMFTRKRRYLTSEEFEEETSAYQREHAISFNREGMMRVLEDSRILQKDYEDKYKFRYKYIYYYFVAKFIATNLHSNLHQEELRAQIRDMTRKLYVGDYANIVIFLVYLTKDEETISQILADAKNLYTEYQPCDFDSDTKYLSLLADNTTSLRLGTRRPRENQDRYRRQLDEAEGRREPVVEDDEILEDEDRQLDHIARLNVALKTMEIMGQIIRNFPGALRGDLKLELATESYHLGLRAFQFLVSFTHENLDDIRKGFSHLFSEKLDVTDEKALKELADRCINGLVSMAGAGVVSRISRAVGSEHLAETYKKISHGRIPTSVRLIDLAIRMDHFQSFPERNIVSLNKAVQDNVFANTVLRRLVWSYLYLFPVPFKTRQAVCAALGISFNDPKMITDTDKKFGGG